jgi:transcriptional regulator with XRE-family HTH domain
VGNLTNFVTLNPLFSLGIAKKINKTPMEQGLMRKEVANAVGVGPSNYSKMEKVERELRTLMNWLNSLNLTLKNWHTQTINYPKS